MSKKKCHHCGIVDSIHNCDEPNSSLVADKGPKDSDGLDMYFIYCRNCHYVNVYKPGWIGNIKFDRCFDMVPIVSAYKQKKISHSEMNSFPKKLQLAMFEDGVLPKGWFKEQCKTKVTFELSSTRIDEMIYLLNYRKHYSKILEMELTKNQIAELFLFRAWVAQFGYRVFANDRAISERIIGETVNLTMTLGLLTFQELHGFSIETLLGMDFISLIENRWYSYDEIVVRHQPKLETVPTLELVQELCEKLDLANPIHLMRLSAEFLKQMSLIRETAVDLGIA